MRVLQWYNIYSLNGALITPRKFLLQILFWNFTIPAATSAHIINVKSTIFTSHMCPWNLHVDVLRCPSQWLTSAGQQSPSGHIRFPERENHNMTRVIFISPASYAHLQSLPNISIIDQYNPYGSINAHSLTKCIDFEQYANISSTSGWGRETNSS